MGLGGGAGRQRVVTGGCAGVDMTARAKRGVIISTAEISQSSCRKKVKNS